MLRHFLLAGALLLVGGMVRAQTPPAPAPAKPQAKAVIQIWLWGGPSQVDTFDPKPNAGYDYCGPLNKPISTNVAGMQIGELLPLLAKQADKYSLIRSMTHGSNGHETASYMMQTGHQPGGGLVYPSVGAIVSFFKGYGHGYTGMIPPYIVLCEGQGRFAEEGFLGPLYKPFVTGGDPSQKVFAVEGIVAASISDERQRDRRDLLHTLDSLGKSLPGNPDLAQSAECEGKAYEMILGDARKVFDLSQETDAVRDAYGRNKFGQSCLVARRLVERGVPYITINYHGWDTHKQHFEIMRRKLPELDQGLSALLQDLADKKLLDSTIVWCCGEFGRTPKVLWEAPWNGGRSHWGDCFSVLVAGGGFKGGHVVGASDSHGEEVAERPVYPQDLIGSIFELLGINPDASLPNPRGLDLKVMPASDNAPGRGRLKEIM
ncbi:MAG TPA: DUF1501 domain-containing protein [Armatimonadota bacterium]